jgi:hypothetical protein
MVGHIGSFFYIVSYPQKCSGQTMLESKHIYFSYTVQVASLSPLKAVGHKQVHPDKASLLYTKKIEVN